VIRFPDGHVRSFDGDRVMGIFSAANKEDRAAKAAMRINWAVRHLVQPATKSNFGSLTKAAGNYGTPEVTPVGPTGPPSWLTPSAGGC
jgi:hypothetical protein